MTLETLDDRELAARANQGDSDAFEALYRRHRDWVVSVAWRLTGNRDDALDVLQETFCHLFERFPGWVLTSAMRAYLYPVVKHLSISAARKRRNVVPLNGSRVEPAAPETSHEWAPEFEQRIASLSEGHREVLRLRFVLEMRLEEIAQILDLPLGTVKSRMHNALKSLQSKAPDPES